MDKGKPQLISALTCEQIITDQEGRHHIIGIFSNINAVNFPAIHSRMAIFCAWLNNNLNHSYTLQVSIEGPVKNPPKIEMPIKFMGDKIITYAILNFEGIKFESEGICKFTIYLDKEKIVTVPIIIAKIPKSANG